MGGIYSPPQNIAVAGSLKPESPVRRAGVSGLDRSLRPLEVRSIRGDRSLRPPSGGTPGRASATTNHSQKLRDRSLRPTLVRSLRGDRSLRPPSGGTPGRASATTTHKFLQGDRSLRPQEGRSLRSPRTTESKTRNPITSVDEVQTQ